MNQDPTPARPFGLVPVHANRPRPKARPSLLARLAWSLKIGWDCSGGRHVTDHGGAVVRPFRYAFEWTHRRTGEVRTVEVTL